MLRVSAAVLCLLVVGAPSITAAAEPTVSSASQIHDLRSEAERSRAEMLRATRAYKESLERLLALRDGELQRALERVDGMRDLFARGMIARADLDTAERQAASARGRLDETWNDTLVAATLITKTLAYEEVVAMPALPPGEQRTTETLIRYRGRRPWTLALTSSLQEFFSRTFGRALPVSAYGQTPIHDKLRFDHRHALDVAVHPDSAEGRAVMDWLRNAGLSFIAFRGAVVGAATGAHIHVGEPSQRLALP